ncbi:metallophosphoesterase [Solitalea lacus]|uniref:metallophosphoesterase n=1 Tax=Solitalea lacus TaxID=2911172 RepID=UPI001EDAF947|nr:metallophosphoesterase [Solitalea lacus]UKJ07382.1 metallophosphoesterase [Solitalea lacus]
MNSGRIIFLVVFNLLLFCADLYVFQAFKAIHKNQSPERRKWYNRIYWFISIAFLLMAACSVFFSVARWFRTLSLVGFMLINFSKLFALPFILIDDIRRGSWWLYAKIRYPKQHFPEIKHEEPLLASNEHKISRSEFLSKAGIIAAAIPFSTMTFGIVEGVYDYKIKRVKLKLPNLPKSFEGLRLAQISDIHSGSFYNKRAVQGGVDLLLAEKPDMIFFTGDLVNDETSEVKDYIDIFNKVKAPLGVYSTLGNHDYGDYKQWSSAKAKQQNLEDLKTVHRKSLGWDLLMNENRIIEQGGEKIAIIGIENWGKGRFPKYGRMDLATKNTDDAAVKLLLSHDPSHWRMQVIPEYKNIDAMFAGHTHGMQFGIQMGDFQWSPIQYMYPEWAGLYTEGNQQLYVNVGYGFLGYPGRVGIYPEITIFELTRG